MTLKVFQNDKFLFLFFVKGPTSTMSTNELYCVRFVDGLGI